MTGRRTRKHAPALPPVNVQLQYASGDVVPVDCAYVGWNSGQRMHVWQVINPRPTERVVELTADELPSRTQIRIERTQLASHDDDDDD